MLVVLAIVFGCVAQSLALNYSICREWSGHDFYDQFFWFNYDDPTHGLVDYVDQHTSRETNLSYVDPSTGRFVMKVDMGDPVPLHGNWSNMVRRSNRIHSKEWFEDGFYIIKATRMPTGCGVWPAFWTSTGDQWPEGGEIDIIEGVNGRGPNLSSLHTAKNCSIDARFNSSQLGNLERTDCAFQPGCASKYNDRLSFGHAFNNNGGGYFALMRDMRVNGSGIGVYFWPNNVKPVDIPDQVAAPPHKAPGTLDSDKMQNWGKPQAFFGYNDGSNTQCDLAKHFGKHQIIFDTTLCGTCAYHATLQLTDRDE